MRSLVTGSAGFIGHAVAQRLLDDGWEVLGLDAFTTYYPVELKERRNARLAAHPKFRLARIDLRDEGAVLGLAREGPFELVIHLAAQAGVRHSLEDPRAYLEANVDGTFNLLELLRAQRPGHLMIASTSSVYGASLHEPFAETDRADHPLSLYAATKKAGEALAHAYSHLYALPTTMFRFFTVYGPWGRPDMALFRFTGDILAGRPIEIFGDGRQRRDFTYIADLAEAVLRLARAPPEPGRPLASGSNLDSLSPVAPWRVVNIGGGRPVELLALIAEVERALGRRAARSHLPAVPGDAPETFADTRLLEALTGYLPTTPIEVGVPAFVSWFRNYYGA